MNSHEELDIVVAGHICFDLIPAFPKVEGVDFHSLFVPGKLINVSNMTTSTGGPVSNTGLALKKLGSKITLMGKVGDDFIGKAIIERLRQQKLDDGMQVVRGENSSYTIVISPPGIDRIFLHNPGTNDTFGADDVNYSLVKKAKIFHLGYPPLMAKLYANDGRELSETFRRVHELGITTSLDMALPDINSPAGKVNWLKALQNTVPFVDLFLPSIEETLFMLDKQKFIEKKNAAGSRDMIDLFQAHELSDLADRLLRMGAKIVAIKCGYKGIYIRTAGAQQLNNIGRCKPAKIENWANRELWEPSFAVPNLASATGSGDSAIAGFLAAYVRGESPENTLRYACAAGGHNVQVLDAVSGIKSWEETTADIKSGWKKIDLDISENGWKFNQQRSLWYGPNDSTNKS
jgi:sugar/nucleoside kinase (ribokinase family)